MRATSVAKVAAACLLGIVAECLAQQAYPDLKKVADALQSDDAARQGAALKELAGLRPNPLDDSWFTNHPMSGGFTIHRGDPSALTLLQRFLASDDPQRRAEAIEAMVGFRYHPEVCMWVVRLS